MSRHLPDHFYNTLAMYFGACPCCQSSNGNTTFTGSSSSVYRSSRRSVTMRCSSCGLLWTMTAHQMGKAARAVIERFEQEPDDDGSWRREIAGLRAIDQWARAVGDARGRAPAAMEAVLS